MAPSPHHDTRAFLVRHGTTEWSLSGQHTSRTDLALTAQGEEDARVLGRELAGIRFDAVWTSPMQRARQTCQLAGLGEAPKVVKDLMEWDYGSYEGLTTEEIHQSDPHWSIWFSGGPGGETTARLSTRADRVVKRLREEGGNIAVFSHGHLLRAVAARWVGLPVEWGRALALDAGSVSVLAYERETPVLASWNLRPTSFA